MKAFRFRLATVLRLREAARDERRQELADARRAQATLERRRDELEQESAALRSATAPRPGPVDVDRLMDGARYEAVLRLELSTIARQMTIVLQEVDRRREALAAADRDVKALEKLRERYAARHAAAAARDEMKQLDELAGRIWRDAQAPAGASVLAAGDEAIP